ncbi:RING finger protein 214 isoform X2 [Paramormyrops kingsleyae]|uniref:RING finger protein 214 isoform X2 n=1 Tax=Paramormyrops kingsleyae TaxID=1676925 RepID=UPI003B971C2E
MAIQERLYSLQSMELSSDDAERPNLEEKEIQTEFWTAENAANTETDWESQMERLYSLQSMELSSDDAERPNLEEKEIQTEFWTAENAANTETDWESQMSSLENSSAQLTLQYEALHKKQKEDQDQDEKQIQLLQQKRDDAIRQHKALFEKMESLRVKLQLNCYKTTRKNFTVKKVELTGERDRLKEETSRLGKDLEEVDRNLRSLIEEQGEEKKTVQRELEDLREMLNRTTKEYEKDRKNALRDEEASLNMQKEMLTSQVKDWLSDAEQYLSAIRSDVSQEDMQQRRGWDSTVEAVRSSLDTMQDQFTEYLHLVQQGQHLDSLPPITAPSLPPIPPIDLITGPRASRQPTHMPSHSQSLPAQQSLPAHPPSAAAPYDHTRPSPQLGSLAYQPVPSSSSHATPLSKTNSVSKAVSSPKHVRMAPPTSAAAAPTGNVQPVAKLEKLLENLGAQFSQCSRRQLMSVLQEIKSSRGTLAGLSVEELNQLVAQRLIQSDKPGPAAFIQMRPTRTASPVGYKLCLMCQNQVDAATQHLMSCSHTVHKECISVWLQSSRNNVCPFCPSK